jgi:predicted P-loop ATPase
MARGPRVVPFPSRPWVTLLRTDDRGRIYPDLANVLIALRNEPSLAAALAFNEMLNETEIQKPLPQAPGSSQGKPPPKSLTDDDVGRLQEWLQHHGMPRIGRDIVGQAVEIRAHERSFHPIKDYLNSLAWDGAPRLNGWLSTYLGVEGQTDYLSAIGPMFIISMVARIFDPGCKCDHMLVLEGEQGMMKSLACSILAGAEYFSDDIGDISSKDAKQHVIGKWIIEESELARFTKATTETFKSFVTRTHEKFRPPYGKTQVEVARQCVFIATTNRRDYNKDETGARRLWPASVVRRIDIEALRRDRDQLFAEAVERYRHGEQWWPDPKFEKEIIRPEQAERRFVDAWEEPVFNWLVGHVAERVSVMDVAQGALNMDKANLGTADQNRIKTAMSLAGWRKCPERTKRGYVWEYAPAV